MTFVLLGLLAYFPEIKNSEVLRFVENPSDGFDEDGFTEDQGDCDDRNPDVYPNDPETCDGFDNDCNGIEDDNPEDIQTYYADVNGGTDACKVALFSAFV